MYEEEPHQLLGNEEWLQEARVQETWSTDRRFFCNFFFLCGRTWTWRQAWWAQNVLCTLNSYPPFSIEGSNLKQLESTGSEQEEASRMGWDEATGTQQDGAGWDVDDELRQDNGKRLDKNDPIHENNGPAMLWLMSPWEIPDWSTIKNPPCENRAGGNTLRAS